MNFVNMPTEKEQKKIERLLKLKSDSELAIFDEVQEIKDEVEQLRSEIPNLDAVLNSVKGQKGDKGDPAEPVDEEAIIQSVLSQIPTPKDGNTPSKSELLALIKPLIPIVKNGKDGINGLDADEDYIISEVLRRIPKPKDGLNGSPDKPEEIVTKIQSLKGDKRLDASAIKNLPQPVVNNYQSFIGRGGGASVGLETIKSSGTIVKQGASTLEFDSTFSVTPTVNGAIISSIGDGTGDVHGPASSTDNAIVRFDGLTGKIIQDYTSGAPTISDTGDITLGKEAAHSITLGASTTLAASGGALTIASGDASSTTGSGGALVLNSGRGGGTTGTAGAITIQPGTQTTGSPPALNLLGRNAASSGTGGAVVITAGNASSSSAGGALTATGGAGSSTSNGTSGAGGLVTVTGNTGGSSSNASGTGGAGGGLTLTSGTGGTANGSTSATGGKGGTVTITAKNGGTVTGTTTAIGGAGGDIAVTAGNGATATTGSANTAGAGGAITFTSGNAGAAGGNVASGNITFQTGTPVGTGTVGAHIFNVNGATEIARINGTGLGVGTNNPTSTLQVQGSSGGDVRAMVQNVDGNANASSSLYLITRSTVGDTNVGSRIRSVRTDVVAGSNDLAFSTSSGTTMAERMRLTSTTLLGIGTTAPTHTLTLPSTSTGIALYNTADQVTNYERGLLHWSANVLILRAEKAGSGSNRNLQLRTSSRVVALNDAGSASADSGFFQVANSTSANTNQVGIGGTYTNSSGTSGVLSLGPTMNQSGTAAYDVLKINVTETATGSGVKRLISAQVGSVDKFVVDNAGNATATTFNPATKQTYAITNVTTDRAYDANATTLDEVADTLGTLIADLRAAGLLT